MSFGGGFGSGSAFGSNNNTGGGFGSAFGSNNNTSTGFGANNTTSAFGATNNNNSTGGGLFGSGGSFGSGGGFGSTNNNNSTGAFGASKPAFGSTGGSAFGAPASTTTNSTFGGFGSNNNTTTSAFGGGNTSTGFGSSTTAGTGGGLFGGGNNNTTSAFGSGGGFGAAANSSASTALGGPVGDPPGTANVQTFTPLVEKESATSSAQNSFQSILFQDPYKKWSPDELRMADYAQGRRFGGGSSFGGTGFGGGFGSTTNNTQSTGAFGQTNTNNTGGGGLFGSSNTGGAFGSNTNTGGSAFGSSTTGGGLFGANKPATGGLFGSNNTTQQNTGGAFGSGGNSAFGSNNNATGNAFGSTNNNAGGGLFGSNNNNNNAAQNKPAFGGGFGQSTTNNTGSAFGGGFGANNNNNTTTNNNTGGGLFGSNNNTAGQNAGGGLFGNNNNNNAQQNTGNAFGSGSAFGGAQNQNAGGGLFGNNNNNNNQQKPAGGLFGSTNNAGATGGGLFGNANSNNNTAGSAFGQQNNQAAGGGGLFGNKPAGGGLFGSTNTQPNNTGGGGLFGNLGQTQNQQQQQPQQQQQAGGLFGSMNQGQNQQKPAGGLFGASTQPASGGMFGNQSNQQPGGLFGNSTAQQQPQNQLGGSMFGNSQANMNASQSLTASGNDPCAFGASLFGNLGNNEVANPGPLATPMGKRQSKRGSILPMYKLNPASANRYSTPQKRGYGLSYSTYGTPNSPSSVASTPGNMNQSLLGGGSLSRSLSKSISTNSLRRNFNVEDSLLNPGAFSASSGSRLYGSNNVKKLVINRDLRPDLFSTPTKEKPSPETPNSSRKLSKRVSFDTSNMEAIENGDSASETTNGSLGANELGYIRPSDKAAGTPNGTSSDTASATPEVEQVKGNELVVMQDDEAATPMAGSPATAPSDEEPGDYWMTPSRDEIMDMNRVQRSKVVNFTVGRQNVGWVKFKLPVDFNAVDIDRVIDDIVVLAPRTCTVYGIQSQKPPPGKGLNVPAQISLEAAWPRSKNKSGPAVERHVKRLQRIKDTTFEDYNAETGEWTFSVEHFTTYGLDDSEDEDEETSASYPSAPEAQPPAHAPFSAPAAREPRQNRLAPPGAFDEYEEEAIEEMVEKTESQSFLANRSVGSSSHAPIRTTEEQEDDEYAMSEDDDASISSGQHLATEQDDDSFDDDQSDMMQETPAGIMRARMRAIKDSATPMKVQVAAGDDWTDMLSKTISPVKRDRELLKSRLEEDSARAREDAQRETSPTKKRVVSDGRGFATSIDLMNSLFEKAKMPAENLQASIRPQGVKMPYKRVSKHLDESNLTPDEREWHNSVGPTWGPDGTLVFAATPEQSAFKRSGRITEKNGLMTVMKGAIVTESQDICIAKFTNELSAKGLDVHARLSLVELVDDVPRAKLSPTTTLRDFSTSSDSKNSATEHERRVWDLASVLFDQVKVSSGVGDDAGAIEQLRRSNLSRFWEHMVEDRTTRAIAMAASSEEKALAALSGHRVPEACKHLLDGKDFRLATLVALIGTNDETKRDMREQVRDWQDAHVLSEFSQPIRALYEMLSGNVCACEGSKGTLANRMDSFVISQRFGLSWQQAFGLRLWYAISSNGAIVDAVKLFEQDFEQDLETPPVTWYVEHGIRGIWNDPEEVNRRDLLWGLLQLYSDKTTDLESVLRPENSQLSPLDYRLCWQLGQALTATGVVSYGRDAAQKADAVTVSYASQLTNEDNWLEATFVLLHLTDSQVRSKAIRDHLGRHAGRIGNAESGSFKRLAFELRIPTQWIWHAKAVYMRSVKKDATGEVECLLHAESYADAHRTFVKEVAPVAVIERDFDALASVLDRFEGHHSHVSDWNVGGEIYKSFLQFRDCVRRQELPPPNLLAALLDGLPAMHGNSPEAGITEYAALTDMAAEVAKAVSRLAKAGKMEHERILHLPLTEDVLLKHSRDLAWSHYTRVMASH